MPGELPLDKIIAPSQGSVPLVEKEAVDPESEFEKISGKIEQVPLRAIVQEKLRPTIPQSDSSNSQVKRAQEIDKVLSDGLHDIFLKMNNQEQVAFKKAGEETVAQIDVLLSETKLRINKIIDLIKKWLKMIPGVNKFFLEQEAKIKTDKIIKIKKIF